MWNALTRREENVLEETREEMPGSHQSRTITRRMSLPRFQGQETGYNENTVRRRYRYNHLCKDRLIEILYGFDSAQNSADEHTASSVRCGNDCK